MTRSLVSFVREALNTGNLTVAKWIQKEALIFEVFIDEQFLRQWKTYSLKKSVTRDRVLRTMRETCLKRDDLEDNVYQFYADSEPDSYNTYESESEGEGEGEDRTKSPNEKKEEKKISRNEDSAKRDSNNTQPKSSGSALMEEDAMKLLATQAHIGTTNVDFQVESYIYKRRFDGVHVINLRKTWEKLLLAARAIAAIENPADIVVVSARPYAQRALLKFAAHTGATAIFGRFQPGCLTNQTQRNFKEPRLLVISDPRVDHQAVTEASYVNIPVISFVNTDSPMKLIDIGIPCNNKGEQSIGLMWWLLAREVLTLRGKISRQSGFVLEDKEIMPDLYFYRDPQEQEKEEAVEAAPVQEHAEYKDDSAVEGGVADFAAPDIKDWAAETANWQAGKPGEEGAAATWGAAPAANQW